MRYFRYKGPKSTESIALRAQYSKYSKQEKKLARKAKIRESIAVVLLLTFLCGSFLLCLLGLKQIPVPQNVFLAILRYIGVFFLGIVGFLVSILIAAILSSPLFEKSSKFYKQLDRSWRQNVFSQACEHLREYLGLQEPCIVTKCYDASDKEFKNHDVCIFVVGNELRITTNLKNGLIHSEKDLGCHAFLRDEITLAKIEGEKVLMTELKAGDTVFLLGYRAKEFIEKNFLAEDGNT